MRTEATPQSRMTSHPFLALFAAALLALGLLVAPAAAPVAASAGYTVVQSGGDGASAGTPIIYTIEVDCGLIPPPANTSIVLSGPERLSGDELGKFYRLVLTPKNTSGGSVTCLPDLHNRLDDLDSTVLKSISGSNLLAQSLASGATGTAVTADFQFVVNPNLPSFRQDEFDAGISVAIGATPPFIFWFFLIEGFAGAASTPESDADTSSSTPDPTAASVSVAGEQISAAGVAGSSGAVRVRGGVPVPLNSAVSPSVGPRGGVVLTGDGMRIALASTLGAGITTGVRAPSNGSVDVSVSGPLAPGTVIEAWVRSTPRLVAAARVPAGYRDGDALTFNVPLGAPLDGGGAIEDGSHTLELRLFTADGFEVIATGLSVGRVAPTSIPAGEGQFPSSPAVPLLSAGLLLAAFASRRMLGERAIAGNSTR